VTSHPFNKNYNNAVRLSNYRVGFGGNDRNRGFYSFFDLFGGFLRRTDRRLIGGVHDANS
jgi:hypothetical protein